MKALPTDALLHAMIRFATSFRATLTVILAVAAGTVGLDAREDEISYSADAPGFSRVVQPFLQEYCVKCHGPEKQKAKLRLDTLENQFTNPAVSAKWAEVVKSVNTHQMPPEEEKQPDVAAAGRIADWLSAELGRAEIARRSTRVVLRRINRAEYNNTIRDLVGVDFSPADSFPEDPPAGGFDNIGQALSISPLQLELYYSAARRILDRALVEGPQPKAIQWHFEPEENTLGTDRLRVKRGGNNILLNPGENVVTNGWTIVRRESWNTDIGFRDFTLPSEGEYIIRFRAAGRVPSREAVVASAARILAQRRDDESAKKPERKAQLEKRFAEELEHFQTARLYDYGPPRVKITQHLGGAPKPVAEMDVPALESAPGIHEVRAHFTRQNAGLEFEYAYDIPSVLENFTVQHHGEFARPELMIDWIELEGPIHPTWPPASHRMVMGNEEDIATGETQRARAIIARFMARAYRRPVQPGEVEAKVALFERLRAEKPSFTEAIKTPLAAILVSPHFLFLIEPEAPTATPRPLTGHELATRLSYFLWSSMPDDELTRLATVGGLAQPAVLRAQVDRMLTDARSEAFVRNFTGQWLGLRKLGANPPAKNLYPEYDRHLEVSIQRESEGFFAEILRHDLDVRNLIKSEFVTINERLARFYDIPGVKGDEIRRVPAPPGAHRGGLVTQASIHSLTSNGTRTSPVSRGVWVLRTLLGTDPGLPVANVGEIASQVPGIDKATVRQRLQIHREAPSCARCHDKIDPLGLALENFNAAGQWRDREGHGYEGRIEKDDPLIDASARMPDGSQFVGVEGLQAQLLKQQELFLTALANQITTYALGRELGFSDRPAVRAAVSAMKEGGYSMRSLLHAVTASELFTTK
jgi:hypothetical protein